DGPTRTRNSPSATSIERSLTAWKPFSYSLLMFSSSTVALLDTPSGSALDRPGGQARDQRPLGDEEHDHEGDGCHDAASGHQAPLLYQRGRHKAGQDHPGT